MPVIIDSRIVSEGNCTPPALNTETNAVSIPSQSEFFTVEGYVDLRNLQTGDSATITEYVKVDATEGRFIQKTYSGVQDDPVLRFHTKTLKYGYRVTVKQTAGTVRVFPFWFIKLQGRVK